MTEFQSDLIAVNGADLVLKGHNRAQFESRLRQHIIVRLRHLGLDWPVRRVAGRIIVDITADHNTLDRALSALGEIPGIASYFPAMTFTPEESPSNSPFPAAASKGEGLPVGPFHEDAQGGRPPLLPPPLRPQGRKGELEGDSGPEAAGLLGGTLNDALIDLARREHQPGARFAVRVARHRPDADISTQSLERQWGTAILDQTDWEGVNLSHPDCTFHVELYPDRNLLYSRKHKGIGGLPVGSSGKVLNLLSGGIDSPVAAFLMARRGCSIECLHFSANYIDRDHAADSPVGKLARQLSRYTQNLTLHITPYVPFDLALTGPQDGYELMLFRRFMLRTATALARKRRAAALLTGDSLSQVASQTLENIVALDAIATLPIFRPLIGFNKQEIIARARDIGTYETSIEPYKDCCALIGRRPKTRAQAERLAALEAERIPDYDKLIATALEETATLRFEYGELAAT